MKDGGQVTTAPQQTMARLDSEASNQLLETLADWNTYLEAQQGLNPPVPPCP